MREVIARIVDGSEYDEFKPLYGTSLTTGWAAIHGFPIGIIANVQGVLFSRGVAEGDPVHPAVQPDRRAAAVHPQRHRLHGRPRLRAARDHQARREDDQRGLELDRAAHRADRRRLLRRRQLRHERARVRAAVRLHLAEREDRRDGPPAARRRAVDRRARGGARRGVRSTTRTPTRRCARRSRTRSSPNRSRCRCPGACSTTGSSIRATRAPCSASRSPRATPT